MASGPTLMIRRKSERTGLLERLKRLLRAPREEIAVGFPDSTDDEVKDRAFYNEFGTVHIPERPFMRGTLRRRQNDYADLCARAAAAILAGRVTMPQALDQIGIKMQGDMQTEIAIGWFTPNAPSTIARKKSSRPLIDTGEMRQAITFQRRRRR